MMPHMTWVLLCIQYVLSLTKDYGYGVIICNTNIHTFIAVSIIIIINQGTDSGRLTFSLH
jgi:hypothetical protein